MPGSAWSTSSPSSSRVTGIARRRQCRSSGATREPAFTYYHRPGPARCDRSVLRTAVSENGSAKAFNISLVGAVVDVRASAVVTGGARGRALRHGIRAGGVVTRRLRSRFRPRNRVGRRSRRGRVRPYRRPKRHGQPRSRHDRRRRHRPWRRRLRPRCRPRLPRNRAKSSARFARR